MAKRSGKKAVVGVVMGSDSDLPKLKGTFETLDELGIAYEARVISAHRTPDVAHKYATGAEKRGLKVIIAAAGGAAHLAGVIASLTTLPVIGVPIPTSALGGLDSLL
ncbi:MAG: 5-(carboxyamino)imidazole ribonucleotide mutase, partial [Phycisphaerae bacterium]|nr:5-(carboxyamino)imidazole ribonucleotide mutase [Phycisphaerae bacterium]